MVDPQLHLLAGALRVDLQAAREAGVRRLDRGRVGEHPPPAERVDDSGALSSPRSVCTVSPSRPVTVAVSNSDLGGVGLRVQQRAQLAVVECRERPRQRPAGGARAACARRARRSVWRSEPIRSIASSHSGRHRARRGLALADLVAVDHQHPRARAGELARDRQAGEARRRRRARRSRAPSGCAAAPRFVARIGIVRRAMMTAVGTAALGFGRCKH